MGAGTFHSSDTCIPQYIFFLNTCGIDERGIGRPATEEGTNGMEESEMPSPKRCLVIEGWGGIQMVGAGSSEGDLVREQRWEKGTRGLARWGLCRWNEEEGRALLSTATAIWLKLKWFYYCLTVTAASRTTHSKAQLCHNSPETQSILQLTRAGIKLADGIQVAYQLTLNLRG